MKFLFSLANGSGLLAFVLSCSGAVNVLQNVSPGATSWPGSPSISTVSNPAGQTWVGESFNAVGDCAPIIAKLSRSARPIVRCKASRSDALRFYRLQLGL